ncbi:MAG: T9SS type A sorting domain-containing protein [Ignavibacteriaceae bacterium]|nr:T9SS type A sorting domain-containing protein [Ignavibacteriaceae bacterium]
MNTLKISLLVSILTITIYSQNFSIKVQPNKIITGDEVSDLPQPYSEVITGESISFGKYYSPNFAWSIHNITDIQTGYDFQSSASPQQVWLDLNNPTYLHAVFTNSQVDDNFWADRTSLYFGSTDAGLTWFELGMVPINTGTSGRSGFPCIVGTSNGAAVIANHNNSEYTTTHTKIFVDNGLFEYNFTTYDPGEPSVGPIIWPRLAILPNNDIVVASSYNPGPDYYLNTLSGGVFSGWQLNDGYWVETYSLAVSKNGSKVGLVYLGQPSSGQEHWVFYKQSTDGGLTWSSPTTVWQAYTDPGSGDILGCLRGVYISFYGEEPCVVFEIGWNTTTSYYPGLPSEIRFWSPNISGGDSKVLADSNNIPYFPNYGVDDVQYPLSRPVIGRSQSNDYLFVAFNATTGDYWPGTGPEDSTAYMCGMFMYSTDGGNTWSTPERFTPDSPLLDWRYVSIVPVCPVDNDVITVHLVMQGDTIPGSTIYGWGIMPPSVTAQYYHYSTDILAGGNPAILVTSPNGGESWVVGTNQTINWTSNIVTDVKIEYTTDGGSSWITIISSTPSNGTYNWTVSNTPSSNCKVKISDISNPLVYDQSNNPFSIIEPSIIVTSPNGGENWVVGDQHNIRWNSLGVSNVKIEYTTDNGTNWLLITNSVPAENGSYLWAIPNTPSSQCKVKITDTSNPNINDLSNGVFTISIAPSPVLTLASPNGGEHFTPGSTITITWFSQDITNIKIEFSSDNGINWNNITFSTPAGAGRYDWTSPNINSDQCLIKICDVSNPTFCDQSDSTFTIAPIPEITVTQPNGGEVWEVNSTHNITWTSSNVTDVKIELSINNGASWISPPITPSTPSTGIYSWVVSNTLSNQCLVRISDVSNTNINDISDSVFSIEEESSVHDKFNSEIPTEFSLYQNFPNPFNPSTTIYYSIPEETFVKLNIYNLLGEEVAVLVNENKTAGNYSVSFNLGDYNSGIYLYKLQAGTFVETKKMVLLK